MSQIYNLLKLSPKKKGDIKLLVKSHGLKEAKIILHSSKYIQNKLLTLPNDHKKTKLSCSEK